MQSINRLIEKSKNARKGFTVLELLVASLLLGMLMTVLTMIFNQSSIAWRTGDASVRNTIGWSEGVADIRSEADNLYPWKGTAYLVPSVFGNDGKVLASRNDYIKPGSTGITVPKDGDTQLKGNCYDTRQPAKKSRGVGGGSDNSVPYIVNVMSYGPDRKKDTRYDNVYSVSPTDDPSEW